jgi:23S rRNA pseudouridine2605 synthase
MATIRLHKAIADSGLASRRAAEEMIRQGKVTVNGEVVTAMGVTVDPRTDSITVDGTPLGKADRKRTYLFYKPIGLICTRDDPHDRRTVFDILPDEIGTGLHSAGRLDMDAEGLLILTNDGDLTLKLTHPSSHLPKTYLVKVKGEVLLRSLKKLRRGVELEDGVTLPASVSVIKGKGTERNTWLRMVLKEGKKNQIKRMCDVVGNRVLSIKRISIGGMMLPEKMKPGTFKKLSKKEIETLMGGRGKAVQEEQVDAGTRRRGDTEARGRGGKSRHGDTETRGRGEKAVQSPPVDKPRTRKPKDQGEQTGPDSKSADDVGTRSRKGWAAKSPKARSPRSKPEEKSRRGERAVQGPKPKDQKEQTGPGSKETDDLGTRSRKGWAVKKPKAKSKGGKSGEKSRRGDARTLSEKSKRSDKPSPIRGQSSSTAKTPSRTKRTPKS